MSFPVSLVTCPARAPQHGIEAAACLFCASDLRIHNETLACQQRDFLKPSRRSEPRPGVLVVKGVIRVVREDCRKRGIWGEFRGKESIPECIY